MALTRTPFLAAAILLTAVPSMLPAHAQTPLTSAFVGHWHYNVAQSKPPPGETPPTDLVTDITRMDPLHARWSITTKGADGKADTQIFDTPANGEFYPVSADTTAAIQLTPAGLQATFKDQSGSTDVLNCNLSPNQQTMTCEGSITRSDGSTARYRDVFDRS